MRKTRLTLDDLDVQSFSTGDGDGRRGTVRAHDAPTDQVECPTADPEWDTCWQTCVGTCDWMDCNGSRWCTWECPVTLLITKC